MQIDGCMTFTEDRLASVVVCSPLNMVFWYARSYFAAFGLVKDYNVMGCAIGRLVSLLKLKTLISLLVLAT